MGVYIPPNYFSCSQEFRLAGADHPFMVVTGHAVSDSKSTQDCADDMKGAWQGDVFGAASTRGSTCSLGITKVLRRRADDSLEVATEDTIVTGTDTPSSWMPPQNCVLVKKRTALAGRTGRGRMYLPSWFIIESQVDNIGVILPAAVTAVQGWMDAWKASVFAAGMTHVLLHDNPALTPNGVTSLQVQSTIATQRRRLRG